MRYHELAKELGVEPEDLMRAAHAHAGGKEPKAISSVPAELEEYLRATFDAQESENAAAGLEVVPPSDRFSVVDEYGRHYETLKVDPDTALKIQEILEERPGRKVGGYCFYPEGRYLNITTFPDGQLRKVRTS